jgi:hypothetical protein
MDVTAANWEALGVGVASPAAGVELQGDVLHHFESVLGLERF